MNNVASEEKNIVPFKARIIGAILGLTFGIVFIASAYQPLWLPIILIVISAIALVLTFRLRKIKEG